MMFIIGRAVSGLGGAGILNGAFTIVATAAPLEARPKLIGLILGVASTGVALGPLIGGALTEHATWRSVAITACMEFPYLNYHLGGAFTSISQSEQLQFSHLS